MQPDANFLMKHLQDLLVRAALQHVTMGRQGLDCLVARLCRLQLQLGSFWRRKIPQTLSRQHNVLDLVHEDVDACIETLRDCIVERCLEFLLFPHDGVEEVSLVNVGRLVRASRDVSSCCASHSWP